MFIPEFANAGQVILGMIIVVVATAIMFGITKIDEKIDETKEKEAVKV